MYAKSEFLGNDAMFKGNSCLAGFTVPYRIWVIAEYSTTRTEQNHRIAVSLATLDNVMDGLNVNLTIALDNLVPQSDTRTFIDLEFRSLRDFTPYQIAHRVPALKSLFTVHQRIKLCLDGEISLNQLKDALINYENDVMVRSIIQPILTATNQPEESASAKTSVDDAGVDRLLGMLNLEGADHSSAETTLDESPVINDSLSGSERSLLSRCLHEVSTPLFKQLNAILHHDDFQKLESAWRSLNLLLGAQANTSQIEVCIINSEKLRLLEDYQQILEQTSDEELPSIFICDFAVDCTPHDLDLCDQLAELSEAFQIPAVINVSNQLLGVRYASDLANGQSLHSQFSGAQYIKWKSLRNKSRSRWLLCTFNRFLLREKYNRHNNSELDFIEWIATEENRITANAGIFIAHRVITSLQHIQWPTDLSTLTTPSKLSLPTHRIDVSANKTVETPLEIIVSEDLRRALEEQGITSLQGNEDSDTVTLTHIPMLFRVPKYDDQAVNMTHQLRNSFAHLLLTSRLAMLISIGGNEMTTVNNKNDSTQQLKSYLEKLIQNTGEGSQVDINVADDVNNPDHRLAKISIRLGDTILNGMPLELTLPIQ